MAPGWMEGGLVACFEKFVLDCDLIQMVMEFLKPLDTSEDALGIEAIREVGPGGHFFGAAHTLARYEQRLLCADDLRLAQQPAMAGRRQAGSLAEGQPLYKQALAEYREPPMDPAIREELDAFVERRKREGGAPTDF